MSDATAAAAPVRVYLALGGDGLAALGVAGEVAVPAAAVTAAVRRRDPDADEEDLEYEALWQAAQWCQGHVVVGAADVPAAWVGPGAAADGPFAVRLSRAVPRGRIVSLHVAPQGDADGEELSWYDITEIEHVSAFLVCGPQARPAP